MRAFLLFAATFAISASAYAKNVSPDQTLPAYPAYTKRQSYTVSCDITEDQKPSEELRQVDVTNGLENSYGNLRVILKISRVDGRNKLRVGVINTQTAAQSIASADIGLEANLLVVKSKEHRLKILCVAEDASK